VLSRSLGTAVISLGTSSDTLTSYQPDLAITETYEMPQRELSVQPAENVDNGASGHDSPASSSRRQS
jgi:hypothetical protein